MQTRRWCGQDHHATVSVESSTLSDRRQRRPDVRRNSDEEAIDVNLVFVIAIEFWMNKVDNKIDHSFQESRPYR